MENKEIISRLKLISNLSELHGENEFKIRALNNAIFNLERSDRQLYSCDRKALENIDGVGKSIAAHIDVINQTGTCDLLDRLQNQTPQGLREVLELPGLGAKKIRMLWEELGVDSIARLREVLEDGSIATVKGFGDKTRKNILAALTFYQSQQNRVLLPLAREMAHSLHEILTNALPDIRIEVSGQVRRHLPVIDELMLLLEKNSADIESILNEISWLEVDGLRSSPSNIRAIARPSQLPVVIRKVKSGEFDLQWFKSSGAPAYVSNILDTAGDLSAVSSEKDIFRLTGQSYIAPEARETGPVPEDLISPDDIHGVLHTHSTYSDGRQSIREMAMACMEQGFEYLGITDHSKSSFFYANGLYENRIIKQHEEIDALNLEFPEFRIFKGIECDILTDGSLDYSEDILERFDFVIISIHSVLNMDQKAATERLVKAISNPYTTILGHMTGRLLLRREGYPVDFNAILEACKNNQVVLELNANPRRLDVDWMLIPQALEKEVMISINPDAHSVKGFSDIDYGVSMARKAHMSGRQNLTSMSKNEIDDYFRQRKKHVISSV